MNLIIDYFFRGQTIDLTKQGGAAFTEAETQQIMTDMRRIGAQSCSVISTNKNNEPTKIHIFFNNMFPEWEEAFDYCMYYE